MKIYLAKMEENISSHELLFRAVEAYCGRCDFTLSHERGKKPFFLEPDAPRFSISHSGSVWICAISENEVGCDVQLHKRYPRFASVAERYFHPLEIDDMNAADSPQRAFFDTWAKKEAIGKLTGRGLDSTLREDCISDLPLFIESITLPVDVPYSAALASFEGFDANEISIVKI